MRNLILLALFLPGFSFAQNVATVGSSKISLKYFKQRYEEVKKQAINPPAPTVFLEDLVRYEMGIQEAERQGLRKDPAVIEKFREQLYKALVEKEIGKKVDAIKVTEKEMRSYYRKNPEYRSSHILIEFKPDATQAQIKEAQKRAKEIYTEVKKSKRPFEELVKLYSDDNLSKLNGGDIGFQSAMTVVPTYYGLLKNLKMNQIGGPIRTLYGFHIVKKTGRNSYNEANKKQIRAAVFNEKRKVIFNAYFKNLKRKYPVKKNTGLLKNIK